MTPMPGHLPTPTTSHAPIRTRSHSTTKAGVIPTLKKAAAEAKEQPPQEPPNKRARTEDNSCSNSGAASTGDSTKSGDGGTLTGMSVGSLTDIEETIQGAFHFLDGPADVLSAATACRRWHALACADSVWRAKFRREKLVEKARLFEVALPAVPGGQGQGGAAASAAAAAAAVVVKDEAAGVGLAFYARVFALKVARVIVLRSLRAPSCTRLTSASRTRRRRRCAGVPDEGRGH